MLLKAGSREEAQLSFNRNCRIAFCFSGFAAFRVFPQ